MDNKKTLIVNYFGMGVGGIEQYISSLMRYAASNGHRVIWFTSKGNPEHAVQTGIADNPNIEKVFFADSRRKFFRKPLELNLNEAEEVVMISFIPEDYVWAEQFRYKYQCKTFYHHLILMNFFGWLTYPEDEFKTSFLAKKRAKLSSKIAHKLDNNNNIRAFGVKQLKAFKKRYNLSLIPDLSLTVKSVETIEALTEEELKLKVKNRKEFKIVTCSRFQFPHKGYLFGLLDVFKSLAEEYDNVSLTYIGGYEVDEFLEKFNSLPDNVKSKINFTGKLSYNDYVETVKSFDLFIGLAGAAATATRVGIPTLVVRHDTFSCETYGFFQDVRSTLKSEPGTDIIPFIKDVIHASEDEYAALGLEGKAAINSISEAQPDYIFNELNKNSNPSVSKSDIRRNRRWAEISILKKYFKFL